MTTTLKTIVIVLIIILVLIAAALLWLRFKRGKEPDLTSMASAITGGAANDLLPAQFGVPLVGLNKGGPIVLQVNRIRDRAIELKTAYDTDQAAALARLAAAAAGGWGAAAGAAASRVAWAESERVMGNITDGVSRLIDMYREPSPWKSPPRESFVGRTTAIRNAIQTLTASLGGRMGAYPGTIAALGNLNPVLAALNPSDVNDPALNPVPAPPAPPVLRRLLTSKGANIDARVNDVRDSYVSLERAYDEVVATDLRDFANGAIVRASQTVDRATAAALPNRMMLVLAPTRGGLYTASVNARTVTWAGPDGMMRALGNQLISLGNSLLVSWITVPAPWGAGDIANGTALQADADATLANLIAGPVGAQPSLVPLFRALRAAVAQLDPAIVNDPAINTTLVAPAPPPKPRSENLSVTTDILLVKRNRPPSALTPINGRDINVARDTASARAGDSILVASSTSDAEAKAKALSGARNAYIIVLDHQGAQEPLIEAAAIDLGANIPSGYGGHLPPKGSAATGWLYHVAGDGSLQFVSHIDPAHYKNA